MSADITRRQLLAGLATGAAAASLPAAGHAGRETSGFCLNTATLRGHKLSVGQEVETAAQAGYGAIEPWIRSLHQYRESGHSLRDLGKRIADLGLAVPSAIGFARWMVNDDTQRSQALEQVKGEMEMLREVGATGMAAPPAGVRRGESIDLDAIAERYAALLQVGGEQGIVPRLEIWGTSSVLSRPSQAAYVAMECGHPDANLLLDVFHIYKGGGSFASLGLLGSHAMACFHMNDYPADPPRESIRDAQRVYPGDGVAPWGVISTVLRDTGFRGWLSLELFNPDYYRRPALEVARKGLAAMKSVMSTSRPTAQGHR